MKISHNQQLLSPKFNDQVRTSFTNSFTKRNEKQSSTVIKQQRIKTDQDQHSSPEFQPPYSSKLFQQFLEEKKKKSIYENLLILKCKPHKPQFSIDCSKIKSCDLKKDNYQINSQRVYPTYQQKYSSTLTNIDKNTNISSNSMKVQSQSDLKQILERTQLILQKYQEREVEWLQREQTYIEKILALQLEIKQFRQSID